MPMLSLFYEKLEGASSVFIEMPFCAGGNIVEYVGDRQPGLPRVAMILSQVLDALAYIHAKNIIHHDIKPANILMTTTSRITSKPSITDFGSSSSNSTLTLVGGGGGTPGFMAPELNNNPSPTAAADMWAFGVVLQNVKSSLREVDKKRAEERKLDELILLLGADDPHARPSARAAKAHRFFTHAAEPEPEYKCEVCLECHFGTGKSFFLASGNISLPNVQPARIFQCNLTSQ